jgi:hypothetical protein
MTESIPDSGPTLSKFRVAAIVLFAALNLAVFLLRALSVWHYGSMFSTGSGEFLVVYAIWKGMHHLPVYEWPLNFPFSLALYNYLTYKLYAFVLRSIGAWDSGILIWGRLFTSLFAAVGAIAQWRLIQNRLNLRGSLSLLSLLFALGLWVSTSMIHYWSLTLRPDLPGAAMVMIALWMVVRQPRFGFAIAGMFFYLAWAFKQSVVMALVAVCLYLLFHKRWRDLTVLASVFAVFTAATLLLGTTEYRFDVLTAPRLIKSAFSFPVLWRAAEHPLITNAYWIIAPITLLFAARTRRAYSAVRLIMTVFVFALLAGLAGMGTSGGAENYMFEAFAAGSTLFQIAVFTAPARVVGSLLMIGCLQPAMQLAMIPRGRDIFGTIRLASAGEYANAMAVSERLAQLKKPIFTPDQTFSLPWFSAGDHAPALVIDHLFQEAASKSIQNGGIAGMLQRGEIPTVILNTGSIYEKELSPKYVKTGSFLHQGVPYNQGVPYDIYSIEVPAPEPQRK